MTPTSPLGSIARDGDFIWLTFERQYEVPIEEVWSALTDSERMARWIGSWSGDPATGTVAFVMSAEGMVDPVDVTIHQCDPPRRLVVDSPGPEGVWRLDVSLAESAGATVLRFRHRLDDGHNAGDIGPGWHYYVDRLSAVIGGEDPSTPWDDYYPVLIDAYASQVRGA